MSESFLNIGKEGPKVCPIALWTPVDIVKKSFQPFLKTQTCCQKDVFRNKIIHIMSGSSSESHISNLKEEKLMKRQYSLLENCIRCTVTASGKMIVFQLWKQQNTMHYKAAVIGRGKHIKAESVCTCLIFMGEYHIIIHLTNTKFSMYENGGYNISE